MDDRPLLAEIAADGSGPLKMITAGEKEVVTQRLEDGGLLIWASTRSWFPDWVRCLSDRFLENRRIQSSIQAQPLELETKELRLQVNGDGTLGFHL